MPHLPLSFPNYDPIHFLYYPTLAAHHQHRIRVAEVNEREVQAWR